MARSRKREQQGRCRSRTGDRYARRALSARHRVRGRSGYGGRPAEAGRPLAEPFAAIGNPPYSLTSPVVEWCLRAPELVAATLLTQLEYARKRTGDYGHW